MPVHMRVRPLKDPGLISVIICFFNIAHITSYFLEHSKALLQRGMSKRIF